MADLVRVSIKGRLPGGEVWSVNPVFSIGGDFGSPVSQTEVQQMADAIKAVTIPADLKTIINSACTFESFRVEARNLDGTLEVQADSAFAAPVPGTGSSNHPFQTSLVVSLRSDVPGASGRGRIYWPAIGLTIVPTTLRIGSAAVSETLNATKTYLSGLETAMETVKTGMTLCVWSRTRQELLPVHKLSIGDVADVQRRRRDKLVESITSVSY